MVNTSNNGTGTGNGNERGIQVGDRVRAEQPELDMLVAAGFAELDENATRFWDAYNAKNHMGIPLPMYRWTEAGREACHRYRYRYSTPMSWAIAIHEGSEPRHCATCGQDLARKWTGASNGKRGRRARYLCLSCNQQGKHLPAEE